MTEADLNKTIKAFRMLASEFSEFPDDDKLEDGKVTRYGLKSYIELFEDQVSKRKLGDSYPKAVALLVAHNLKVQGYGGFTAEINKEVIKGMGQGLYLKSYTLGPESVTYASDQTSSTQMNAEFGLTTYGMKYLELLRGLIVPIVISAERDIIN